MPRKSKNASDNLKNESIALAGHLAIGMGLGVALALVLLFGRDPSALSLVLGHSPLLLALYVGVCAMTFGLGTVLTGLIMEATKSNATKTTKTDATKERWDRPR